MAASAAAMDVCAQSDAAAAKEEAGKNQAGTATRAARDICAQSDAAAASEVDGEDHAGTAAETAARDTYVQKQCSSCT